MPVASVICSSASGRRPSGNVLVRHSSPAAARRSTQDRFWPPRWSTPAEPPTVTGSPARTVSPCRVRRALASVSRTPSTRAATAGSPSPRATTAACAVCPPRSVTTAVAASRPGRAAGLDSVRTTTGCSPSACAVTASAALKTTAPEAIQGVHAEAARRHGQLERRRGRTTRLFDVQRLHQPHCLRRGQRAALAPGGHGVQESRTVQRGSGGSDRAHTEKRQTASLQAEKPHCQEDGALRIPEAMIAIEFGDCLTERGVSGINGQPQH